MPQTYLSRVGVGELRAAAAVASTLSFRAAAEQLHIAQPSVSRKIARLEDAIGVRLFDRDRVSVSLTAAGRVLAERVPELFESIEQVLTECAEVGRGLSGPVRVAFSEAAMSSFLPPLLRAVRREFPGCRLQLTESDSQAIIDGIRSRRFDVGFALTCPEDADLTVTTLPAQPVGVVLADDHVLAEHTEVALSALRDEPFILFPRPLNPDLYDRLLALCLESGFTPYVALEVSPRSRAIALVAAGEGIATISTALRHLCVPGTVFRPLAAPAPELDFCMVARAGSEPAWMAVLQRQIEALA